MLDSPCFYAGFAPSGFGPPQSERVVTSNGSVVSLVLAVAAANASTGFQIDWRRVPGAGGPPAPAASGNCTYTAWSAPGACSEACGPGVATRTREVDAPMVRSSAP